MKCVWDIEEYARNFENILQGKQLFFFGAGEYCKNFIPKFKQKEKIIGILDNNVNKIGTFIEGIPVIGSEQLKHLDHDRTVVVITSSFIEDIEEQLKQNGIEYIFYYPFLDVSYIDQSIYKIIASHSEDILNSNYFDLDKFDLAKIKILKDMLEDDLSRELIDLIVIRRKNKCLFYGDIRSKNQYFPKDIFVFSNSEVMIDGGAYTGDTVEAFKKFTGDSYKKIFAFEPDHTNYKVLCKNVKNDPQITCLNVGLWDENTFLRFSDFETESSVVSSDGASEVEVRTIDSSVNEKVTFIKMDIEGAERKALEGAKNVILRDKPKLAICIYHKKDDLWEIPLYLKQLVPEYKLYIRHHSNTIFETVLYATL